MTDTTLDMDANGTGIDATTGETIVVALEENPRSSYHWGPESELQDNIMELKDVETEDRDDGTRHRRFAYRATQPGTGTINLHLRDDASEEVAERYNVVVQVRG